MIEIARVAATRTTALRARSGVRSAALFTLPDDTVKAGSVAASIPLGNVPASRERDANDETQARQQVGDLLHELAALQRNLLAGGDPAPILQRLDGMLAAAPSTASPPLLAVLSAVRLRAQVELARRQQTSLR